MLEVLQLVNKPILAKDYKYTFRKSVSKSSKIKLFCSTFKK